MDVALIMLGLTQYAYGCIGFFFAIEGTYHGGGLLFGKGAMMRGNRFTNHTSAVHDGKLLFVFAYSSEME